MNGFAIVAAALSIASSTSAPVGVWQNPRHTIAVQTALCGSSLCGKIVAAAPVAVSDARESGVAQLIGTSLLRDYRKNGPDSWRGIVFVPDMGRTFDSRLTVLSPNQLRISGCILKGLLCKSQIWTRV
jgi:uncharacterized protein (DUF2147 family)